MRLNADAVYEVMCRAVQEGRANAHSESRARYIEEHKLAPRLQTSLRPWLAPIPGKAAQCVKIFDSPKVIVQLERDPNCDGISNDEPVGTAIQYASLWEGSAIVAQDVAVLDSRVEVTQLSSLFLMEMVAFSSGQLTTKPLCPMP